MTVIEQFYTTVIQNCYIQLYDHYMTVMQLLYNSYMKVI